MHIVHGVSAREIFGLNLIALDESQGSGSLWNCQTGNHPIDGWTVKNELEEVIGWCAVFNCYGGVETHFLVHPKYRRQGIGKELYNLAFAKYPHMVVYPWNEQASTFFRATNHPSNQTVI